MAYNGEKLTKLKALKDLAQRIEEGYATKKSVEALENKVDELTTAGGEPNKLEAVKVNGTALEITDKAVDVGASIASAVAAAGHLKRVKVDSVDDIDPAAENAEQYIYMVPKTDADEYVVLDGTVEKLDGEAVQEYEDCTRQDVDSVDDIDPAAEGAEGIVYRAPRESIDRYEEYMVLDGKVEHVGSTKVDMSGYVPAEEGMGLSSNDYTDEEKAKLAGLELAADIEVMQMLDDVFGAPVSRNFSDIYGLELPSGVTKVQFVLGGFSTSFNITDEFTVYDVAESLDEAAGDFGMKASVDSASGYLTVTDNESGEAVSYTIKINGQQVYPEPEPEPEIDPGYEG